MIDEPLTILRIALTYCFCSKMPQEALSTKEPVNPQMQAGPAASGPLPSARRCCSESLWL